MSRLPSRLHLSNHSVPSWLDRPSAWVIHLRSAILEAEMLILLTLALLIGLGAGVGAVIFRWLINTVTWLSFTVAPDVLSFMGSYYVIIIPAIGGAIVGPLIYFFAREAKGHGVPEVMEAVALRGGRIRPVVVVVKALASSICIGTGGSVGREGPIVQIGAAWGSTLGQVLHMPENRIKSFVACGAAGGIAATFNAPIAGVIFALEVIHGEFTALSFSTVVVSSVAASVVGRVAFGNVPAFIAPEYSLVSLWEYPLYAILGLLAGLLAVVFVFVLYKTEDLFDLWHFPEYLKPIVGGLIIGTIGLVFPQIFGVGYETMDKALVGDLGFGLLLALILVKVVATSITIGSGGSGGVFAPSLFLGAVMGGSFGKVVNALFPAVTASSGAYALVGMAAVFAAGANAPITAILIVFEMTGDYRIILPLMAATVIATVFARFLNKENIYTMKLVRRGVRLRRGVDVDIMETVQVHEAMSRGFDTVATALPLTDLARLFEETHHHGFPVLNDADELAGIVTLNDLQRVEPADWSRLNVDDIATKDPVIAYPDQPLAEALRMFAIHDVGRIPVVERGNPRRLLGVVRRSDVVRAYQKALARRVDMEQRVERMKLRSVSSTRFSEVDLDPDSPAVGHVIRDLALPENCLIVSIRRGGRLVVPHGGTELQAGDRVALVAAEVELADAQKCLLQTLAFAREETAYAEFDLEQDSPAVGKCIQDLKLPRDSLVVSVRRAGETHVAHGDTRLEAGDAVVVYAEQDDMMGVERALLGKT
ncbi:MAG: chloride channel protein [Chloroflexi bacterium]|nr:chloride channel protein [Chloroflexota bacterium]MBU1746786.1 chloride channel protein [Chloroflexota bacterium]MBU1878648.1 chloride channel protein [Chloroflexota bacterium]